MWVCVISVCYQHGGLPLHLLWSVAVQMHDMENQIAIANRRASEAENRVRTTAAVLQHVLQFCQQFADLEQFDSVQYAFSWLSVRKSI